MNGLLRMKTKRRERQTAAMVEVLVRAEEMQRAVFAVFPAFQDRQREMANAAAAVEEEHFAVGGLDLDAGRLAAVNGQVGQSELVAGTPRADSGVGGPPRRSSMPTRMGPAAAVRLLRPRGDVLERLFERVKGDLACELLE